MTPGRGVRTLANQPRGFDRELTRDFAKRESVLRFEVERWRARAESLNEENEYIRASNEVVKRRNADAEGTFSLQSRELDRLREEAVGQGAVKTAKLEEQCERQRRMLRELAVASEALAKDNVLLSSELVSLRDRGDEAEEKVGVLSERLDSARKLYLAGQKTLQRQEETRGVLPDGRYEKKLNQLLTVDVLAKSKPPQSFPVDESRNPLGTVRRSGAMENGFVNNSKNVPGSLVHERRKLHVENESLRKLLQRRELDRLREEAVGQGAVKTAKLEEQCERQRRMLRELAVASEALAKDNVLLSSELVSLRDRGDEAEEKVGVLSERLDSARKLYLAGQKTLQRQEETRGVLPDGRYEKKLNQLLTVDVLAKSKPPQSFPVDESRNPLGTVRRSGAMENGFVNNSKNVPGSLVHERRKLHVENESLRKLLQRAKGKIVDLQEQRLVTNSELASLRKDGGGKAVKLQSQLAGAARRLRWLVDKVEKLELANAEKDTYAASLEKRLLAQHKTMGKITCKASSNIRKKEERELEDGWNKSGIGGKGSKSTGGSDKSEGLPGVESKATKSALDSAVSFLKSGPSSDSKSIKMRTDGWVPGAGARTPTARDALRLARQARVRTSSPSGEDTFDEGELDDDDDDDIDYGEAEIQEVDNANARAMDYAARRVDFGHDTVQTPGKMLPGSRAGSTTGLGNSPGTELGNSPGSPGEGDFSMDGIEAYISNLHALHRKSELAVKTPQGKKL